MYESAKKVVQSLTGKVRKFDEGYRPDEEQLRVPRGPRGSRPRSYEHDSRRIAFSDPYARQAEYTDRRRRSMSPSRSGHDIEEGMQIKGKSQHGKHHSGVPYGYREGRVVDRYEPGT